MKQRPYYPYYPTAAFNPTADNMLQRSGGINAGSARHAGILPKPIQKIKH
jgi:hypothetical protein